MSRLLKISLCLLSLLLVLTNCRKDKWKADYERPDWLVPPMYQQLQAAQGGYTFKLFLACINKTAYKNVLDRAGYYTLFAPHDSAFQVYLDANFGGSIANLDSTTARKIVAYSMVYNAYKIEHLVDYQKASTGYVKNDGYKKRTVYYKGAYTDSSFNVAMYPSTAYNNYNSLMYDINRHVADKTYTLGFDVNDNACKYLPFFFKSYFDAATPNVIPTEDYNYFFPNSVFNGLNVLDARIVVPDIMAENGYIHVIDKVLTPRYSIDEYMSKNKNYSVFKHMLDTIAKLTKSTEKSTRIAKITGEYKTVFYKRYSSTRYSTNYANEPYFPELTIQPQNENYLKADDNDAQKEGYTLFVPNNDAMNDFINNKLLTYYKTMRQVPMYVIVDFLNAHIFNKTVWPSAYANASNAFGEAPFISKTSDVVDRQFMSNGIFYGTSKVQAAKKFYSVFGEIYLNPDYYQQYRLIAQKASGSDLVGLMTDPTGSRKYAVLMVHNSTIVNKWRFNYNNYTNAWSTGRSGGIGFFSAVDYIRWAKLHIAPLEKISDATMMSDDNSGYNVVMMKSLDENFVAARWFDIPVDPANPLGPTKRSLGFYSSGNADSVDVTSAVAVAPYSVPTALPATKARWVFVPTRTVSSTNGPNIFGDTLNYSTLIYSQVPVGRVIQRLFYDNIYDHLKRGDDESTAVYHDLHYPNFYNYGSAADAVSQYWYCNTYYPTLNLKYRDTMYFAYMRNMNNRGDYGYFDKSTGTLTGVPGSVCYTVLVPNGDAMAQAATDGYLPENTSVYNSLTNPSGRWSPTHTAWSTNPLLKTGAYYNTFTYAEFWKIRCFFRMHILRQGFSADGKGMSGNIETSLTYQDIYYLLSYLSDANASKYNISGNVPVLVTPSGVTTQGATISDVEGLGSKATIVYENGNILGDKVVIHQVSGYLKYKKN